MNRARSRVQTFRLAPRRPNRSLVPVVILLVLALLGAFPAVASECITDGITGVPLPASIPGVCVADTAPVARFVQVTEQGLLIALVDTDESMIESDERASTIRLHNRTGLVIYCPIESIDPSTGAPGPECLADFSTLLTGPAAMLGFGTVQASISLGAAAPEHCEASLHVLGELRDAGGTPFDLQSSLARRIEPEPVDPQEMGACGSLQGAMRVATVVTSPLRTELPFDATQSTLFLADLGDEEAALLESLLRLDESELRTLLQLVRSVPASTESGISLDSVLLSAEKADCDGTGNTPNRFCLLQRLRDLLSNGGVLSGLRDLVVFQQVRDLLVLIRDSFVDLIQQANALKMGYDAWLDPSCGSTSQCHAFKEDLKLLVMDAKEAADFTTIIPCLAGQPREGREFNTELIETMIDNAPSVLLYGMFQILEEFGSDVAKDGIDSAVGGWRTMFRDVLDALNTTVEGKDSNLMEELETICDIPDSSLAENLKLLQGDPLACFVLRPEELRVALDVADNVVRLVSLISSLIDAVVVRDDVVLAGVGVALAGGGGGTNFPNLAKVITKVLKELTGRVPTLIGRLDKKRNECIAMDEKIESDLTLCRPRFSYFMSARGIPPWRRPTFQQAVDHVERRIREVRRCQILWNGCMFLDIASAEVELARAKALPDSEWGFQYLCDSLCEVRGTKACNIISPNKLIPESCTNGVDDDGDKEIDCDDKDCLDECAPSSSRAKRNTRKGLAR